MDSELPAFEYWKYTSINFIYLIIHASNYSLEQNPVSLAAPSKPL